MNGTDVCEINFVCSLRWTSHSTRSVRASATAGLDGGGRQRTLCSLLWRVQPAAAKGDDDVHFIRRHEAADCCLGAGRIEVGAQELAAQRARDGQQIVAVGGGKDVQGLGGVGQVTGGVRGLRRRPG